MPGSLPILFTLLNGVPAFAAEPAARPLDVRAPPDRPDRLIEITGLQDAELIAEFSTDGGDTWYSATLYPGTSTDEWLGCEPNAWNKVALQGRLPAGAQTCLWNYFFDLELPCDEALLRLRSEAGFQVVLEQRLDFQSVWDVVVIDRRNVYPLAGGVLPEKWSLQPAEEGSGLVGVRCKGAPDGGDGIGGEEFFDVRRAEDRPAFPGGAAHQHLEVCPGR